MPRSTENIRHNVDETPDSLSSVRSSHSVFVVHENTIALPAGRRNGKCSTEQATKNIQKRYWKTGIPMGMELEAEYDGPECSCDCGYCDEADHGYCDYDCDNGSIHEWVPVQDIITKSNEYLYKHMREYAISKGRETYPYINPVIAKYDGSLDCGVEFNFQPMTVESFRPFAQIVQDNAGGLSGYHNDSAGIHIHMPKAAFTDAELYLFLVLWRTFELYVDDDGKPFLEIICQRSENQWCHYNVPFDRESDREDLIEGKLGKIFYDVIKNGRRSHANRYSALNLNGHGTTMEVRAFNSNLRADRLIKNMAFLDACWRYVHLLSDLLNEGRYKQALQYVTNLHSFVGYCKNPLRKGFNEELARFLDSNWDDSDSHKQQSLIYGTDLLPYLIQINEEDNYGGTE